MFVITFCMNKCHFQKKNIYFYRLELPYKDGDKIMLETCEMPAIT